jgi:hypothetical protein
MQSITFELQRMLADLGPIFADVDVVQMLGVAVVSWLGMRGMTAEEPSQ